MIINTFLYNLANFNYRFNSILNLGDWFGSDNVYYDQDGNLITDADTVNQANAATVFRSIIIIIIVILVILWVITLIRIGIKIITIPAKPGQLFESMQGLLNLFVGIAVGLLVLAVVLVIVNTFFLP